MRGTRQTYGVFWVSFASLLTLLLARNPRVFSLAVHEQGDAAANSIITEQAKHFTLLVGNYSRLGFSHPGPAFFYCQAFGEWLFHDLLGIAPAPWNGQWLALLILNSALVATTLMIIGSWARSWPPVALCGAAAALFFATHQNLLSSSWMPYLYVAPFLLLLTAAASVAAGRARHLWALALAAGLLIHGHAEFLFFVPVTAAFAMTLFWYARRGAPARQPIPRRDWLLCAGVLAVFALPMVLNVVLHWPGEFGKYFGYGHSRGIHSATATGRYLLHFWAARPVTAALLVVLLFGAVAGCVVGFTRTHPSALRNFLGAGFAMAALTTVLFTAYAARGIDNLGQEYIGYFYWAVPLLLSMLAALGLAELAPHASWLAARMPKRPILPRILAVATAVAAMVVAALSPALATNPDHAPELPRAVATLSSYTSGRPVLVDLEPASWPALTGLLVAGARGGQRVCARDPAWRFMVTSEFVCTGRDLAEGRTVVLSAQPPIGTTVLARLDRSAISTPPLPATQAPAPVSPIKAGG
jgi:hypothetical protein